MTAGAHQSDKGTAPIDANGGRSTWLLGMLLTFKAVAEDTDGEYSVFEAIVPPGAGAPPHIHHRESEAFYILEGEFEILNGENFVRAGVGEYVRVPSGVVHGFTNVGHAPARLLALVTPGGLHEKLFAGMGQPALTQTLPPPPDAPPDFARLVEIAHAFHTELLPPPRQ